MCVCVCVCVCVCAWRARARGVRVRACMLVCVRGGWVGGGGWVGVCVCVCEFVCVFVENSTGHEVKKMTILLNYLPKLKHNLNGDLILHNVVLTLLFVGLYLV